MLTNAKRAALLGSVAAFAFGGAHAQTTDETASETNEESCEMLAERLADDTEVEADMRTDVEEIVASGDVARCRVVFTTWDTEGMIDRDTLELVATDQVTQRMIVQQEIEVDADVAVYQPPAEVDVDTGAPEVVWTLPRQSATVTEQAPKITVRQARPTVHVELPQPRVTVMIPEPEVTIIWPETTLDMSKLDPQIEVRIPEPVVTVSMPDPVIELTIGGDGPTDLVELEDGRFAPQGAEESDLEPRISLQGQEPTVRPGRDAEMPEITFNRSEPEVTYEGEEPEVTVEVVGEPEILVSTGQRRGDENVSGRERDTEGDDAAAATNERRLNGASDAANAPPARN